MNADEKLEKARQKINEMLDEQPMTDREMVIGLKADLAKALSKGLGIVQLFGILRTAGFKGNRRKFTELLEELGLWTIKSKASA